MKKLMFLAVLVALMCSCNGNKFKVSGTVDGAGDTTTLFLETSINGNWLFVDSVVTSGDKFSLSVDAPEYPNIYRLGYRDKSIYFPIDSIESVSFVHNDMSLSALFTARLFWYSYHVTEDHLDQSETFITCSVSPEFYTFLLDVFNEDDWSLGLFATISGNVGGNVKNGYGYFFASDVQRKPFTYHEIYGAITPENE